MKTVTASAPGKLILMGEHAVVYGYPCIITAVDQVLTVEARIVNADRDMIIAPQVAKTDFVGELLKKFKKQFSLSKTVEIKTHSEFSDQTGLGSSSACTVATCKALNELFDLNLSQKEIFNISFETVLSVQGSGSGADVASAVFGGTIFFQNKGETIEPLIPSNMEIVIGNTFHKAPTKKYIQQVAELKRRKPEFVESIFKEIADVTVKGKDCIASKKYQELGKLMSKNHTLLQQLEVSSEMLDKLVNAAMEAGAFGAKLSGAGGGDNMFALVSAESKISVERAIEQAGGKVIYAHTNYATR